MWQHRKWILNKGHSSIGNKLLILLKGFEKANVQNFLLWNYQRWNTPPSWFPFFSKKKSLRFEYLLVIFVLCQCYFHVSCWFNETRRWGWVKIHRASERWILAILLHNHWCNNPKTYSFKGMFLCLLVVLFSILPPMLLHLFNYLIYINLLFRACEFTTNKWTISLVCTSASGQVR